MSRNSHAEVAFGYFLTVFLNLQPWARSRVADRTIGMMVAAFIGAAAGILLAWLFEITGHPSWSMILMILCAVGPSILIALYEQGERRRTKFVGWVRCQGSPWLKILVALVLVVVSLLVVHAVNVNPRDYAYLPLLLPTILSAILLGFGPALFTVVVSTIIADYVYAPPEYSFAITEWKEVVGVTTFAILGGFIGFMIHELVSFRE
jgi:hypothetical protein